MSVPQESRTEGSTAVAVYSGHCKETHFEWQHKLFQDFEKVTPELFTFDTFISDETQENHKLSWKINYYLNCLQTNGYNHKGVQYRISQIDVHLMDKIPADYTALVTIYVRKSIMLDVKFDTASAMAIAKKVPDMVIKNKRNDLFIHVKVRLLHQDKSISRIVENYKSYVKSDKSCNVDLNVGDEKFSAHREILSAHSPVFASMFESDMIENNGGKVQIEDVESNILKHLIDYIYYAKVSSNEVQDWLKIIVAAKKYFIDDLFKACEDFISDKLDAENFSEAFTVADLVESDKLKKDCVKFFVRNKDVVLKTEGYKNLLNTRTRLVLELFSHVMLCCSLVLESDEDDEDN